MEQKVLISKEKLWQIRAGRFAVIANWALHEFLDKVSIGSNEHEQANDYLNEIIPYLDFDEELDYK